MGMSLGNASGRGAMGMPPTREPQRGFGSDSNWARQQAMRPGPSMGPGPAAPMPMPWGSPPTNPTRQVPPNLPGGMPPGLPPSPPPGAAPNPVGNMAAPAPPGAPPPSSYWYGRGQVGTGMDPAMAAQAPAGNSSYWYGRGQPAGGGQQFNNPMAQLLAGGR